MMSILERGVSREEMAETHKLKDDFRINPFVYDCKGTLILPINLGKDNLLLFFSILGP